MSDSIQQHAALVLKSLADAPRDAGGRADVAGQDLATATGLAPMQINDAAELLVDSGYAEWLQVIGTHPFRFMSMNITPQGRYELERASAAAATQDQPGSVAKPPLPVGSPFGFDDIDWEQLAFNRSRNGTLFVVMGYQFTSDHYCSDELIKNIESQFSVAVAGYNSLPGAPQVELDFSPLAAGYGEHLFNEIARDIIGADIAVFETSDLNPNVMLEMGVALTWGVRVLPIKADGRPPPPSDVSGQTWADYVDSGRQFVDAGHSDKLIRVVERAARKKAGRRGG